MEGDCSTGKAGQEHQPRFDETMPTRLVERSIALTLLDLPCQVGLCGAGIMLELWPGWMMDR